MKRQLITGTIIFIILSHIFWLPLIFYGNIGPLGVEFIKNPPLWLPLIMLVIFGYASYLLSKVLDRFDWEEVKKFPKPLLLIILFLAYRLILSIINYAYYSKRSFYERILLFPPSATLLTVLLVVSIIFLLVRHKYSLVFGSLYFLFLLLNPFSIASFRTSGGYTAQGALPKLIQFAIQNGPWWRNIIPVFLYGGISVYLLVWRNKDEKLQHFYAIGLLTLIILLYVL